MPNLENMSEEILNLICEHSPRKDLLRLRLSSRAFNRIATPVLFGKLEVLPLEDRIARCRSILDSEHLRACIRSVVLHTALQPDSWLYDWHNDHMPSDGGTVELPEERYNIIEYLPRCPRLVHAGLHYSLECKSVKSWGECPEPFEFRESIFQPFMESVGAAEGVKSLSIRNLQSGHDTTRFRDTIARLKSLALQVTTEDEEAAWEHTPHLEQNHELFDEYLIPQWLQPVQNYLTELMLFSARMYWGYYPRCDLRDVHFPALKRLALGKMSFAHDWQIDWIIAHGATLEALALESCPIIYGSTSNDYMMPDMPVGANWVYNTRWQHIFDRMREEMPRLSHIGFSGTDDMRYIPERRSFSDVWSLPAELGPWRYVAYRNGEDCETLLDEWEDGPEYPECEEEDQVALHELVAAVRQRKS